MKVAFNIIGKTIKSFSSKGAALVRKECGLDIADALTEGFKKIPEGAVKFDAVRVGRNFKPNECYTDIFTFRNESGDIVSRVINKVDGTNTTLTKKSYEELCPFDIDLDDFGDEIMYVEGKRIRSFTRENGKITSITDETITVPDDPNPFVTKYKREILRDGTEKISIHEHTRGGHHKFLENEYEYIPNDFTINRYQLVKSNASSPELSEIAQNSYLLPYVSPRSRFPYRMAQATIDDANFIIEPKVRLYKEASTRGGYYSECDDVNINLLSKNGKRMPRETLTDTIGHEVGHAKWDMKCKHYEWQKEGFFTDHRDLRYTPDEIPDIIRYQDAIDNYVPAHVDRKKYWENFAEVTARKEGAQAVRKYRNLEQALDREFKYKHPSQFTPASEMADEDSIYDFLTITRTL